MPRCWFRTPIVYCDIAASDGALPIYDNYKNLVGGFILEVGDTIRGFISGRANEVSLRLTTGEGFWFTAKDGPDGKVDRGIVSEWCINEVRSVWVDNAREEVENG